VTRCIDFLCLFWSETKSCIERDVVNWMIRHLARSMLSRSRARGSADMRKRMGPSPRGLPVPGWDQMGWKFMPEGRCRREGPKANLAASCDSLSTGPFRQARDDESLTTGAVGPKPGKVYNAGCTMRSYLIGAPCSTVQTVPSRYYSSLKHVQLCSATSTRSDCHHLGTCTSLPRWR
jgi:hypothetical protein